MFFHHPDGWPCEFYSFSQGWKLCELNYCSPSDATWTWDWTWESYVPDQKDLYNESFRFRGDHLLNW